MLKRGTFLISFICALLLMAIMLGSCNGGTLPTDATDLGNENGSSSADGASESNKESAKKDTEATEVKELIITPTVYDVDVIKDANYTAAGSFEAWAKEVDKPSGSHNNDPTDNSVINSPFHTLSANGKEVPVYTARCAKGAHSFAWIDVSEESFELELKLTLSESFGKCVVLPESRSDKTDFAGKTVTSVISETGSYTFTFAKSASASVTDPTFAPLTVMIFKQTPIRVTSRYKTVTIEPGYHADNELEFTDEKTVYIFKAGYHDICSIGLPSDSILYIEQGAYLKATERKSPSGQYNKTSVIHTVDTNNVKIISRGLLDCGALIGADQKNKTVVHTARSRYVTIEGLTVINSNTWTICAYAGQNININKNLLLGYRMYSDGIMMSDCSSSAGRYNFVRTGDDAIEFKGTGWNGNGSITGKDCIYEYNDLWTDKGAGYCLTWENNNPMQNMTFKNNSVGFALASWTDRNTAIDCLLGINRNVAWSDITFENIEIYRVNSKNAIAVQIGKERGSGQANWDGGILKNVIFKNISINSASSSTYAFRMHYSAAGGRFENISLVNVTFCQKRLTASDKSNSALFCNQAQSYWDELTVS